MILWVMSAPGPELGEDGDRACLLRRGALLGGLAREGGGQLGRSSAWGGRFPRHTDTGFEIAYLVFI